ncbi:hypothetical protein [Salinilacihabitans rarus]|uniref:hypothetical protein n=1 Tax=Salinilacihabitans rarus TaxID=2961596 RepID=UPI0020C8C88E|nr:hypothetical protein [Salinilacihabitans rarus]
MTGFVDADDVEPMLEPEYVGAHSALASAECQHWDDADPDVERTVPTKCGQPATHTIVLLGKYGLREVAMCDIHGEPEDVTAGEREWTGALREHIVEATDEEVADHIGGDA